MEQFELPVTEKPKGTLGKVMGVIIIIGVLILGGLYVWGAKLEKERQMTLREYRKEAASDSKEDEMILAGSRLSSETTGISFIVPEGLVASPLQDGFALSFPGGFPLAIHSTIRFAVADPMLATMPAMEALTLLASSSIEKQDTVLDGDVPVTFHDEGIEFTVRDPLQSRFIRYIPAKNASVVLEINDPAYLESPEFKSFLAGLTY